MPKTAVITPFGLWEFVRMPFGLCNASRSFQCFMDEVLEGLNYCFVYVDGQLMSYLGMGNFYRRFIRGGADVFKPLTDTLSGSSSKVARIEWTTPILEAFEGSKQQMVSATHPAHLGKKARLALSIDASGTHLGI